MVTLTNSTTSTPSVSDVAVSGINGANKSSRLKTFGRETITYDGNSSAWLSYYGNIITMPESGILQKISCHAYVESDGTLKAVAVVFDLEGNPIATSTEVTFGVQEDYTQVDFEFRNQNIPSGEVIIAFHSNSYLGAGDVGFAPTQTTDGVLQDVYTLPGDYLGEETQKTIFSYATLEPTRTFNFFLTYQPSVLLEQTAKNTYGIVSDNLDSYFDMLNYLTGISFPAFPGGYLSQIIYRMKLVTADIGNMTIGVYLDGELIYTLTPREFFETGNGIYPHFFTPPPIYIKPGTLTIAAIMKAGFRGVYANTTEDGVDFVRYAYTSDELPNSISLTSVTTAKPMIYFEYLEYKQNNSNIKEVTWGQTTSPWSSTSNSWDSYTDITSISNI